MPTAFTVLADTPVSGTDRVEFIWADNAIQNRYLEVRTFGDDAAGGNNTNTGLAATDIFYFGSMVGDTFNEALPVFLVTAADEIEIQSVIISAAAIDDIHDMDRNGVNLVSDRIVTRLHTITALAKIDIGDPPAAPAPANAIHDDGAGAAVASALAAPRSSDGGSDSGWVSGSLASAAIGGGPATTTVDEPAPDSSEQRSAASPHARGRREFDPAIAFASEHRRRQLLANAASGDWLDDVDESLVDLLGRHRFVRAR